MAKWETRVWIEGETIHVGDREIGDRPQPEGTAWRKWFVNGKPSTDNLFLVAGVYGTDSDESEILLNGRCIGRLPRHGGGKFRVIAREIPAGLLHDDENELVIRAARLGDRVDNFLVRQIRVSRRIDQPSPPLPEPPSTGGGKEEFFRLLARGMRNSKWGDLSVPGFAWSGLATHEWEPAAFAAFDADSTDMLDYAYVKLNAWADKQKDLPTGRVAVAVFDKADAAEIQRITRELQAGTRMKRPMRMTAVLDLATKRFHEPQETGWAGGWSILFNSRYGSELEKVVRVIAG